MATRAAGDEANAAATPDATDAVDPKPRLSIVDLPIETQREIISNCSQSDLICVALVSKHFHELASSQLYRNFHIIFPDDDDVNFDSPIDGLAGGLDTFTTSDYNYAKHLRDLSMDTLSASIKGESSYQSYLYNTSCGKFFNTLLYLTLKKAKSLEVFRWNIRVELNRPVYRELHKIASLKKLHIRMQAGESYYMPPPPLPVHIDLHAATTPSHHWPDLPPLPPSLTIIPPPPGATPPMIAGPPPALTPHSKSVPKSKISKRGTSTTDPSTLSGFKNLRSLSILDIDNLDIVSELNVCLKNSSSTLTELQLSLSDALASQARKPPPASDPDDSDVDDEFQVVPVNPSHYDATAPVKAFRAQEERKIQETVLGKIFEALPTQKPKKARKQSRGDDSDSGLASGKEKDKSPKDDAQHQFFMSVKSVLSRLMSLSDEARESSTSQQEILEKLEKAAKKFLDSIEASTNSDTSNALGKLDTTTEGDSSKVSGDAVMQANSLSGATEEQKSEEEASKDTNLISTTQASSSQRAMKAKDETSPEDIDIAHVEAIEDAFEDAEDPRLPEVKGKGIEAEKPDTISTDREFIETMELPIDVDLNNTASVRQDEAKPAAPRVDFETLAASLESLKAHTDSLSKTFQEIRAKESGMEAEQIRHAEANLKRFTQTVNDIQMQEQMIGEEIGEAERQFVARTANEELQRSMRDYIRSTRGLALTTLRIHLIPVKASVLSRSINFACLKELSLLNVGNQAPIWTLLTKENKVQPLPLRIIFTDNVSNAFLTFASQLDELHELFMIERGPKYKPESFAPRSTTTMDQIRRLVLKKHIGTLKRLMIKDESNSVNWDANEKAMILICSRGRKLEELAVSMNIHAVHAFMQYFYSMINLRAIHILHFRNNDTCIWVVREILMFIVDNLSHHPELKLEWIAMENNRVDRVVRPDEEDSGEEHGDEPEKRNKGKGKMTKNPLLPFSHTPLPIGSTSGFHDAFQDLPIEDLDSESENEDGGFDNGARLRFKTVGPLQFYDVWGVKIFDKEIRSGKL